MKSRKKIIVAVLLGALLVNGGCSLRQEETEYENSILVLEDGRETMPEMEFMEMAPVVDYEKPKAAPNLIVDRYGYAQTDGLTAYIRGRRIPDSVFVKEKDSRNTVYRGTLQKIDFDENTGMYYGVFSFQTPKEGEYFIECDHLGRSYSFRVGSGIYKELLVELCAQITSTEGKDHTSIEELMALILAYEWHPEIFDDKDENGTPDVLDQIAAWIRENDFSGMENSEIYTYTAFLAKFSYLYRQYDYTYATECLQMATTIFARVPDTKIKSGDQFFALAELYRATGRSAYGSRIPEYQEIFQSGEGFFDDPAYLYGTMTYFMTRQSVNTNLCDLLMQKLLLCGEEAAGECATLLDVHNLTGVETDSLLYRIRQLVCVNYVLESIQYSRIMEDVLHYLMGRNAESFVYYDAVDKAGDYLILGAELADFYESNDG